MFKIALTLFTLIFSTFADFGKTYYEDGKLEYEGEFKDGKFHGKGRLYHILRGGLLYDGNFKEGEFHGKGRLYDSKGRLIFEGEFKDGKKVRGARKQFQKNA